MVTVRVRNCSERARCGLLGGECEEDEAGGVGVDAVDDVGLLAVKFGVRCEEADETFFAAAAWEDGEARGFVDGDDGVVVVEDLVGLFFHRILNYEL